MKWLIILNLIQAILFKNIRLVITFFWGLTFVMSVRTDVDVHGVIGTGGVSAVSTELTSAAASVSSLRQHQTGTLLQQVMLFLLLPHHFQVQDVHLEALVLPKIQMYVILL